MSQGNKELRDLLFGGQSRKKVTFEVMGKEFELLELTLEDAKSISDKNEIDALVEVAMNNVVTPGTSSKVFELTDRQLLLKMGAGHPFIKALSKAMQDVMPEDESEKKL